MFFYEALRSWESTEAASVLAVWLVQIWDGCWTSWCLCRMETSVSWSNYWMNCWEMYCWRSCYPEDGSSWLWWSSDAPSSGQHSICPKSAELTRVAPFNQSNLIQYQAGPPRITTNPETEKQCRWNSGRLIIREAELLYKHYLSCRFLSLFIT